MKECVNVFVSFLNKDGQGRGEEKTMGGGRGRESCAKVEKTFTKILKVRALEPAMNYPNDFIQPETKEMIRHGKARIIEKTGTMSK